MGETLLPQILIWLDRSGEKMFSILSKINPVSKIRINTRTCGNRSEFFQLEKL